MIATRPSLFAVASTLRRAVAVVCTLACVLAFPVACRRPSDRPAANDAGGPAGEPPRDVARAHAPAAFDASPHRVRANVPAIAWAAVTREREILGAVGRADPASGVAASPDVVFEAASLAKMVIATCVMRLVEEHRLDLDADVSTYVGFEVRHPKSATPITTRMLLSHTSSIADDLRAISAPAAPESLRLFLRTYVQDRGGPRPHWSPSPPGTRAVYSNVGATLAAHVVEALERRSFRDVAKTRVLAPLGMSTAEYRTDASPSARAVGHALAGDRLVAVEQRPRVVYPVVDLYASARDLARFARFLLRRGELDGVRLLSERSIEQMTTRAHDAGPDGLGFQLRAFGRFAVSGHEGEDTGASTALYVDRARGVGAVVLANGDAFTSGDPVRIGALGRLAEDLLDLASGDGTAAISSAHAD